VRYTQAALGFAWALLQPILMMVIFSIFLGRLASVPSDGIPYAVFAFTGLLPWTYFANAVGGSSESLVSSANLVSKVYFPRLVLPISAAIAWLPDFVLASSFLVVMMLMYGLVPAWTALLFPLFGLFALLAVLSVSLLLSALNVAYRDVRHAVPFVLQLWLFATPVVYPASLVPDRWQFLLGLNPMAGVVSGFRWAVLGGKDMPLLLMAESFSVAVVMLIFGLFYFRRVEHRFADVI
jgi:lipopolysaccharide transport system permease protein